jgi:predicted lipid-binding transport protein (Tim44 family)
MIALLVAAAFFIFRFFMRRNSGTPRLAAAGAGAGAGAFGAVTAPADAPGRDRASAAPIARTSTSTPAPSEAAPAAFTGLKIGSQLGTPAGLQIDPQPVAAATTGPVMPEGFDLAGFERLARLIFIRMQAANDGADINDLRNFTTPELFAELRLDLQERGPCAQHTDVLDVQATVVDFAQETDRQVVSVRYRGRVQEAEGVPPEAFDEVWHLVKPLDDSRNWAIAGIQQSN